MRSLLHWRSGRRGRLAFAAGAVIAACSATAGPVKPEPGVGLPVDPASTPSGTRPAARADSARVRVAPPLPEADDPTPLRTPPVATRLRPAGTMVRVLLGTVRGAATFSADVPWEVVRSGEATPVAAGSPGREWQIEREGAMLRVVRSDGAATPYRAGTLELRPAGVEGTVKHGSGPYRGNLVYHATDSGVMVVNVVPLEAYLQGVVPREIGRDRTIAEMAAIEAQAIAARSYALIRLQSGTGGGARSAQPAGRFDVRATVADQVYGGVLAETPLGNRAVANTRGLVLRYGGRTVNAPYHSTCGGSTAEAPEVWQTRGEPYLQRVSDRIPGTERDYCEPSPRYRWTRVLDAATLDAAVARHLREVQPAARGGTGTVRAIRIGSRTPSGRAAVTTVETTTGTYALRGNEARYVLRRPGGEILNSTYFSVVGPADARGGVRLEGRGYGHGIGMCQWGAIGRARAGQGFRTILQAYFPGTTVGPAT